MISVIVPIYNTEKYLSHCIDSILSQTYTKFELILVNDGSKDKSGEILDSYAKKDKRIKVFHRTNQGVTQARAFGVSQAECEWITFVDSDDTLPLDALEHYSNYFSDETDIIIGWFNHCRLTEDFLTIEEYRRRNIGRSIMTGSPTHVFRRRLVTPFVFDIPREIVMGEDMIMNIRIAFNTEKPVQVVHQVVYNYFIENPDNTTNRFKDSLDHEHLLHQYRLLSIPEGQHQLYMNEMIGIRIYDLCRFLNFSPFNRTWKKNIFTQQLVKDVFEYEFKGNKADIKLLYSSNIWVQIFWILYKRMIAQIFKLKTILCTVSLVIIFR